MNHEGRIEVGGSLAMTVKRGPFHPSNPRPRRSWAYWRQVWAWRIGNFFKVRLWESPLEVWLLVCWMMSKLVRGAQVPLHGRLFLAVRRGDGSVLDLGCAGCHLITTAGKKYLASTFANTAEPEVLKYHGYGTGSTAANVADTTLGTELTTQYATDNTRPTGTQSADGTVTTYTTVGTLAPDSGGTIAVTEWGLFSQAANSGGTLFDRQVFSAVNLVASSDSLATTYVLTIA